MTDAPPATPTPATPTILTIFPLYPNTYTITPDDTAPSGWRINNITRGTIDAPYTHACNTSSKGYYQVSIGGREWGLHQIIALQFIHNPCPTRFTYIDHIDNNPRNNSIKNLIWTTPAINGLNQKRYDWRRTDSLLDHVECAGVAPQV